jgi:hypothetical protein
MQLSSMLVLAGITIAAASPLAGQQLQARDPSDKSGNSYVVLHTESGTFPNTPGTSIATFSKMIKYRGPDGIDHNDLPCAQPWTDKNCYVSHGFCLPLDQPSFFFFPLNSTLLTKSIRNAPSMMASSIQKSRSRRAGVLLQTRRSPLATTGTITTPGAASLPAVMSKTTNLSAALWTLPAILTPRI